MFGLLHQFYDVGNLPNTMRNASGQRRRNAQRLMDAGEVVVHVVQRDRRDVVIEILRECVCEAG